MKVTFLHSLNDGPRSRTCRRLAEENKTAGSYGSCRDISIMQKKANCPGSFQGSTCGWLA